MKRLLFALPLLLAGCATYEPAPIDWAKESAALAAAPSKACARSRSAPR